MPFGLFRLPRLTTDVAPPAGLTLTVPPASEPLTLADAKLHLRVDTDDTAQDARITALITAARRRVETLTRRALITQTWELALDDWPRGNDLVLPIAPLQSVTSVTYGGTDGSTTTWPASNYVVDTYRLPGRLRLAYGVTWPAITPFPNAILVRWVAGYGATGADVPATLTQAMLLLIAHWYERREEDVVGLSVAPIDQGVLALCAGEMADWGIA